MKINLYCNTQRGVAVLYHLRELLPGADIKLAATIEHKLEPKFLDDLRAGPHNGYIHEDHVCNLLLAINWRRKISQNIYDKATNAFVIHDSLLPKYRGFSPLINALLSWESEVGATMIRMTEEIDGGPIVAQKFISTLGTDVHKLEYKTTQELVDLITQAYLDILSETIPLLEQGWQLPERVQDVTKVSYARKIDYEKERIIDRSWPLYRQNQYKRIFSPPYPQWKYND